MCDVLHHIHNQVFNYNNTILVLVHGELVINIYFSGIRHGQIIVIRDKSGERLVCDQKYSFMKQMVHCI